MKELEIKPKEGIMTQEEEKSSTDETSNENKENVTEDSTEKSDETKETVTEEKDLSAKDAKENIVIESLNKKISELQDKMLNMEKLLNTGKKTTKELAKDTNEETGERWKNVFGFKTDGKYMIYPDGSMTRIDEI